MNPYPSYKDSGIPWLGHIPAHWETRRFKFLSSFNPSCKKNISDNDKIGYVPMEHIRLDAIVSNSIEWGKKSTGLNYFENGDLLMAKVTPCFENGNIAIAKDLMNDCGVGSSELFVFRPYGIDVRFLFYLLQNKLLQDEFISSMRGTGGLKRIDPDLIYNYFLPLPPEIEQQTIASWLDKKCGNITSMFNNADAKIAQLQRLRRAIIANTVMRGLNPNIPLKDSGLNWIPQIPSQWEVIRLKRLGRFCKGLSITKSDLVESGHRVVSYGQIHSKSNSGTSLIDELIRFVPDSIIIKGEKAIVKRSSFIFADTSEDLLGCGNCVYNDSGETLYAYYHTIILQMNEEGDNRYLGYLFLTDEWRSQIRNSVNGVKVYSITQAILDQCDVILPPQANQIEIADFLDKKCAKIDALIAKYEKQKDLLVRYRKAIITQAVTGQICIYSDEILKKKDYSDSSRTISLAAEP